MNWYYVEAGQQMGPVDDAGLATLVAAGRVTGETLVWREGMANWQAYQEVHPGAAPAAPGLRISRPAAAAESVAPAGAGSEEAVCVECGRMYPINDTIRIGDARVCANCKPIHLQKMREGVSASYGGSGVLSEEQILARQYRVELGEALSRGWSIFPTNAGTYIGTLILVGLAFFGFTLVASVANAIIPFSGQVLQVFYTVPLLTGLVWLSLRLVRGEPAGVGDGFAGFGARYLPLVGMGAIQLAINIACALPVIIGTFAFGLSVALSRRSQATPAITGGAILVLIGLILVTICAVFYINIMLTFAPLLIIDKNYSPASAIRLSWKAVSRRWWATFGFLFVGGLIYMVGMLFCLIGGFVTAPLYFNMKAALYDDNFRELAARV